MTSWEVERDAVGWSIVVVTNGKREEVRSRWTGMSCIDAQVIAKELNSAYDAGWDAGRKDLADMFMAPLGD